MANLPLAFAELLGGGVLLTMGITGQSPQDVLAGAVSLKPFDVGADAGADATASAGASPPASAGSHSGVDPFARATGVRVGRTDMGVDVSMRPGSPILAPLPSVLERIDPNWYAGQPGLFFRVTDGPYKGRYWYVAEQIAPSVKVGDRVNAGDQVGTYAQRGTAIEIGWAANAAQTLAQATSGYHEGQVTHAGQDFLNFLRSLMGGAPGHGHVAGVRGQVAR